MQEPAAVPNVARGNAPQVDSDAAGRRAFGPWPWCVQPAVLLRLVLAPWPTGTPREDV